LKLNFKFIDSQKKKGKANNTIRLYIAAIQNFLKYKNINVTISFIGNMPKPIAKKINGKHEWRIDQLRQFIEATKNYRDKAIIICMFQSGLAVNEICNLDYGDIQDEFEEGVLPICLKLVREKTSVEFKTFFGRDAVKYLRLYLATRKDLKPESPLFSKARIRGGEERLTTSNIQQIFGQIAKDLPFIKQNGGYNPARPHSLRAGFNSRLIGKIDGTLREFWMGHAINGVASAYLNMPTDELRKLYMTAEEYLKIEKTSRD
jgi:integrase